MATLTPPEFTYVNCSGCKLVSIEPPKSARKSLTMSGNGLMSFPMAAIIGGVLFKEHLLVTLNPETGLKVTTNTVIPREICKLTDKGAFKVSFNGYTPTITRTTHECPASHTKQQRTVELAARVAQGEREFSGYSLDEVFAAMSVRPRTNEDSKERQPLRRKTFSAILPIETAETSNELLGICVHSSNPENPQYAFTLKGAVSDIKSTTVDGLKSETTLKLKDGKSVTILVKEEGIFINNELASQGNGTFEVNITPKGIKLIKQ